MADSLSSTQKSAQDVYSLAQPTRFSPLVQMVAWIAILLGSAATHVIWVEWLGYKDKSSLGLHSTLFGPGRAPHAQLALAQTSSIAWFPVSHPGF
jgi:hypothetical protein